MLVANNAIANKNPVRDDMLVAVVIASPLAVIASVAKQSLTNKALIVTDCFVAALLAMTAYGDVFALSPLTFNP
jgi:flavin reductase (DIM6/NTAB) family NADH-FMN oxidoreductase RutF